MAATLIKFLEAVEAVKGWIWRHLFYWDYVHMQELIDDVIRLEGEKKELRDEVTGLRARNIIPQTDCQSITTANSKTYTLWVGG